MASEIMAVKLVAGVTNSENDLLYGDVAAYPLIK